MSNQDQSEKSKPAEQDISELAKDDSVAQTYFPVSPLKMSLMSICTLGLYEYYWFYKNWVLIKEREKSETYPFWRAWFSIFYCFSFFKKVQDSLSKKAPALGEAVPFNPSISPGFLATGWIVLSLLINLPDPHWLVSSLTFIFLFPVLSAVELINESVTPGHHKNGNFTVLNIFGILLGGLLFALIVVGTFSEL